MVGGGCMVGHVGSGSWIGLGYGGIHEIGIGWGHLVVRNITITLKHDFCLSLNITVAELKKTLSCICL